MLSNSLNLPDKQDSLLGAEEELREGGNLSQINFQPPVSQDFLQEHSITNSDNSCAVVLAVNRGFKGCRL